MYTLREFNEKGVESNRFLGKSYRFIHRDTNHEEFREAYKIAFNVDHVADLDSDSTSLSSSTYGMLTDEGGSIIVLNKDYVYYILSPNGNTLSNLSYKKR